MKILQQHQEAIGIATLGAFLWLATYSMHYVHTFHTAQAQGIAEVYNLTPDDVELRLP